MKKRSKIDEFVSKNPLVAIGLTVFVIGLVIMVSWLTWKQFNPPKRERHLVQIEFGDGKNSVVVERNGKVTIKTPYGTFTQFWDKEKIRRFFEDLDNLDFDKLSKYIGGDLAIQLTLGDEVIEISIDDPRMEQVVDELQTTLETTYKTESLGDYKPIESPDNQVGVVNVDKDKETGSDGGNSQTDENPWNNGIKIEEENEKFSCEKVDVKTGKKVIISNTVCVN